MERPIGARTRIVDAAAKLMHSVGLANTTTKEIALHAHCSEAAIYKYFRSKEELFLRVLDERLPSLDAALRALEDDTTGPPTERLIDLVATACAFYEASVAMAASLFADPALRERHRQALAELKTGPHVPIRRLARYLAQARDDGRIGVDADPDAAAAMLLGACLQRAFLASFSPPAPAPAPRREFAERLVATLEAGLRPR